LQNYVYIITVLRHEYKYEASLIFHKNQNQYSHPTIDKNTKMCLCTIQFITRSAQQKNYPKGSPAIILTSNY
jgi:type I site-specific restriction endonuclease